MRALLLCTLLLAACETTSDQTRDEGKPAKATTTSSKTEKPAAAEREGVFVDRTTDDFGDTRPVPKATDQEIAEFNRIWELFRKDDPAWTRERDRFKRKSDAAGYLLAGHMIRYDMQVNVQRDRAAKAVVRAKDELVAVGAPCAPALIDLMILDRIPMKDGRHFIPDDITRQDCVDVLERMGTQATPELLGALGRKDIGIKSRRFLARTLGGTKDPRAYDPLVSLLRNDPSWQVRADAAPGLGKLGDRRALEPLAAAAKSDPDPAVVKRAESVRKELARKP
jgi:hypothetical protein